MDFKIRLARQERESFMERMAREDYEPPPNLPLEKRGRDMMRWRFEMRECPVCEGSGMVEFESDDLDGEDD